MSGKPRILRITTVPISLKLLLRGQLTFFRDRGFEVLTASAAGDELDYIRSEGISHVVVPMTRIVSPLRDLLCLLRLIQVIRTFKPDIIHTHTPKAGLLGMLAGWLCRAPIRMHTVAGLPLMEAVEMKRFVLNFTESITYACATAVYPNSKGLYNFIKQHFNISQSKFKIIGRGSTNGIDTDYFKRTPEIEEAAALIRSQHAIETDEVVYGFVGRLVQDKGLIELVSAFKQLAGTRKTRLLLIGSFEEELDPLPKDVMQFLLNDSRVVLAGFQNDVRPWIAALDVFVFPSYREGFPNGVMQAACLEVPCIVSDINGCNELIDHGTTGWIVPAKDSAKLFEAMQGAALDLIHAKQMAEKARHFVVSNFDKEYVWNALLEEYQHQLAMTR